MTERLVNIYQPLASVSVLDLDLSLLVGHDISLFTEQFPGKDIIVRVTSTQGNQFEFDAGSRNTMVDNLVHGQTVVLQFVYKGERISVKAQFRRTVGGRKAFALDNKVTPLSQRRFHRVNLAATVRVAPFPISTFARKNLARLRWIESSLVNFSSGGLLTPLPGYLERDVYLIVSLSLEQHQFPPLLLGQVRHCYASEDNLYNAGVEFVTMERGRALIPPTTIRELPPVVMSYRSRDRELLNKKLLAGMPEIK